MLKVLRLVKELEGLCASCPSQIRHNRTVQVYQEQSYMGRNTQSVEYWLEFTDVFLQRN